MKKKNYNPFKLWGTYLGLALGLVVAFFTYAAVSALCEFGSCKPRAIILPIIPIVIGFLLGWGAHGVVKLVKK